MAAWRASSRPIIAQTGCCWQSDESLRGQDGYDAKGRKKLSANADRKGIVLDLVRQRATIGPGAAGAGTELDGPVALGMLKAFVVGVAAAASREYDRTIRGTSGERDLAGKAVIGRTEGV